MGAKPQENMVQLNVRVTPAMLAKIDAEATAIIKRDGIEPSRSQVVNYLLRVAFASKATRKPAV